MYSLLLGCGSPTTMALLNLRPESKRAQNLLNECAMWLSWNARWRHVLMARGMSTELPQSSDVLFQNYSPLIPPFNFYALLDNTVSRLCNAILPPPWFSHPCSHGARIFDCNYPATVSFRAKREISYGSLKSGQDSRIELNSWYD